MILSRTVTLVLLDPAGELVGMLPGFEVERPWWQETGEIVTVARERYGLALDVLRLLWTERPYQPGGAVTYLAQERSSARSPSDPVGLSIFQPADPVLSALIERDEPRRAAYARPGGPADTLAWAETALGPVVALQLRTWNLSAIWRLEGRSGVAWLKQLPGFLHSEPAALGWLGEVLPELVPRVIALGDEGRELLEDVPGADLYGADLPTRLAIAEQAHRFQTAALTATSRLLADGVPDRRGSALTAWVRAALVDPEAGIDWLHGSPAAELLTGLDERMAAVADCGLPDTLVHGDAHPGNLRGDGARLVFLDWSECFLGHPAFDALRLVDGLPEAEAHQLLAAWASSWRRIVPGCDPGRALELLRPVASLLWAAVYARFLANIEPAERGYHLEDVPRSLAEAVAAGQSSNQSPNQSPN